MNPTPQASSWSRRQFLGTTGGILGRIALGSLLDRDRSVAALRPLGPHHRPRARSVIYLHMAGSPPQQDLFDEKPDLTRLGGTPCPEAFIAGKRLAFIKGHPKLLAPPHAFRTVGASGRRVSELLPHFGSIADDVCMIHSLTTDQFNHAPAQLLLHTGTPQFGGASFGAWTSWGLGSLNEDLPAFLVLVTGGSDPSAGKSVWGSGYLPSQHQATRLRNGKDPVLFLSDPDGMDRVTRRTSLDGLRDLNALEAERSGDPEVDARIAQYELAFRMQTSVPDVMDISKERSDVLELYGAEPGKESFANNCLLARRLVERGVRFVQLYDWGWDVHGTHDGDDLVTWLPKKCAQTDRAVAALVLDLKRRGLLEDTLVVWGGEFGRTPMLEARNGSTLLGRDHHPECFTMWLCGGGTKPGFTYGATDDLGHSVVADAMPVQDLQATLLHILGLDAHRLRYPYMGLDQRLIGPADTPRVHERILA